MKTLEATSYKLSEVIELHSGYAWRGLIKEIENGAVRAIQPKAISKLGELIEENLTRTELTGKKQPDWVTEGDVLLINKGLRNTVAYMHQSHNDVVCAPTIYTLRPKARWAKKLNMKFIAWQLTQPPAQNHFKRSAEGSLQVSLRRKVVEDTPLAIPTMDIQDAIANLYEASLSEQKVLQAMIENRQRQMSAIATELLNKN